MAPERVSARRHSKIAFVIKHVLFQLCTLRGSILEDVITLSRHAPNKGHPAKDVVEYVCPEINVACLKVASNPKVQEQIMRVDEHNVS